MMRKTGNVGVEMGTGGGDNVDRRGGGQRREGSPKERWKEWRGRRIEGGDDGGRDR